MRLLTRFSITIWPLWTWIVRLLVITGLRKQACGEFLLPRTSLVILACVIFHPALRSRQQSTAVSIKLLFDQW